MSYGLCQPLNIHKQFFLSKSIFLSWGAFQNPLPGVLRFPQLVTFHKHIPKKQIMRLFVLNVSLSALAINVSSILRTRTFVQTRKLETFLAGSKHLASQSRDEPKIEEEEEEEDPKKLEMLQRLGIDKDDSQCKTGAQLRKERKLMNKVKTKKNRGAHSAKSTNVVQTNRFVLGNGIEALNPTTLLGLVGSTAP